MLDDWRGPRPCASRCEVATERRGRTQTWSEALRLFREESRQRARLSPGRYTATASACGKGEQWQWALSLLDEMIEEKVQASSATVLGSAHVKEAGSGSGPCRC
ncbi:unnamed protein product [Prorocentrum cordatum]|uniref:Pentatricopeptide repeat-containing protein n=1 Tax=Prorocentrum cordatum TaxID=2364126 RepID=A0ABN9W5B6_9DINO|nr:unnamed protein product [Polarella glacialis]